MHPDEVAHTFLSRFIPFCMSGDENEPYMVNEFVKKQTDGVCYPDGYEFPSNGSGKVDGKSSRAPPVDAPCEARIALQHAACGDERGVRAPLALVAQAADALMDDTAR